MQYRPVQVGRVETSPEGACLLTTHRGHSSRALALLHGSALQMRRSVTLRALVALATLASLLACTGQAHPPTKPRSALIFSMSDGVDVPQTGLIKGDLPSTPEATLRGHEELISAVQRCSASFAVDRSWLHVTYVLVDPRTEDRSGEEIFGCVKKSMRSWFSVGWGSPDEPQSADHSGFRKFWTPFPIYQPDNGVAGG